MNTNGKQSLFDDKRIVMLSSFLVALMAWIVVAGFINPGDERQIPNIRIDYAKKQNDYLSHNLQIVGGFPAEYAEVLVRGEASVLSNLGSTDVTVYADYSAVNTPGVHIVPLRYDRIKPGVYSIISWSVKNSDHSLRRNPTSSVQLTFEEVGKKSININVKSEGITAEDGYFKDNAVPSSQTVVISGPKNNVARVASAEAVISEQMKLKENMSFSGVPVTLLDESGNKLNNDELGLTLSAEMIEVNIQILEIREIKLEVGFVGVPHNFDLDWFKTKISLSHVNMKVVGNTESLNSLGGVLNIGDIDLSTLSLDWKSETFPVNLPGDGTILKNYGQLKQVNVNFDSSDLVQKDFDVENIVVRNVPKGFVIEPVVDYVSNVTLIGPRDQIDRLLAENIIVEIDAFGLSTSSKSGQQTIPARVLVPSANRVFASGDYTQICDVTVE